MGPGGYGRGRGGGFGRGLGRFAGPGGGRSQGLGAGGYCVCPKCGAREPHMAGTPCQEQRCSQCGARMLREGSEHHELWRKKHEKND